MTATPKSRLFQTFRVISFRFLWKLCPNSVDLFKKKTNRHLNLGLDSWGSLKPMPYYAICLLGFVLKKLIRKLCNYSGVCVCVCV